MNIEDKRKTTTVQFADLSDGDVFEFDFIQYMKTQEKNEINAVSVYQGIFEHFDCNTYVEKLDAELIIRG